MLTMIEVDGTDPAFGEPDEADRARLRRRKRPAGSPARRAGRSSRTGTRSAGSSPRPAAADLRDRGRRLAPRARRRRHLRRRRRDPGDVHRRAGPAGKRLVGVEAVIDKDLASALLAADLNADALLIVTDVDAVYADWGTPEQRPSDARRRPHSPARSSQKGRWARRCGRRALRRADRAGSPRSARSRTRRSSLRGEAGTVVALDAAGLELVEAA